MGPDQSRYRGETAVSETISPGIGRALDLDPNSPSPRFALALSHLQRKAYQDAATELDAILAASPDHAYAHLNLGVALIGLGRREEAIAHHRRAVELVPNDAVPLMALAVVLRDSGERDIACRYLAHAVRLGPHLAEVHFEFGRTLAALNRPDEAVIAFRQALALRPEMIGALLALGDVSQQLQQFEEAERCYEQAFAFAPKSTAPIVGLGHVFLAQGQFDKARVCFSRALELQPDLAAAYFGLALCEQHRGRLAEAARWHQRVIALEPAHCDANYNLAMIRKFRAGDAEIQSLRQLLAMPGLPLAHRATLSIAMGKICNDIGEFDEAFGYFKNGNELRKRHHPQPYDPRTFTAEIDNAIATFTKDFFLAKGRIGSESELPVFVVGVVRSGTTLVEQILASHSQIRGRGELDYLRQIVITLSARLSTAEPYPACLKVLSGPIAKDLAEEYLARLENSAPQPARSIDKRPGNFLRLGLIALLFPRARIIHCVRDPIDTCLSSYFLGHRYAPFANDLNDLGRYYRDYQRLMSHYRSVLPNQILDVPYEALVDDQAGWTRKLIDFLGLPWEDRCLAFHETERPISTPSFWQVRQPIYRSSVGRWRHYKKHLEPLFAALRSQA
jgi:tetratricopeptide (TPR) repeat protein